jgi:hypothetical protein
MASKATGIIAGLVVVALAAGGFWAKSTGLIGGAAVDGDEGAAGAGGRAKGRAKREGGGASGDGERVGGEGEGASDASREPDPEPGTYAFNYRSAKAELEMARHDLEFYKEYSRYPESARPADEVAAGGGLLPHHVAPTSLPLVRRGPDGKPDPNVVSKSRAVLVQDRFQLSPGETVVVRVHALSEKDKPLPMRCSSAKAFASAELADKIPPFEFGCTADKENGVVATFDPAKSPFRAQSANIALRFELEIDREDGVKESGSAETGIHYVATSPGRLTGVVREAYENGSMAFYLGFEAAQPGFYRLNVRADNGQDDKVFAHMNIRQQVDKPGPVELRAELFGKLIIDNQAKVIRLRDVDGEFVPPAGEIASIPGKDGVFYTVKSVDLTKVKGEEWSSPEKDDRMKHYEDVLKKAQDDCDKNYDGCQK